MADEPDVVDDVAEEAAEVASPDTVAAQVDDLRNEFREFRDTVLARLDSLTSPETEESPADEAQEHEEHDVSPIPPPWTHRKPWRHD